MTLASLQPAKSDDIAVSALIAVISRATSPALRRQTVAMTWRVLRLTMIAVNAIRSDPQNGGHEHRPRRARGETGGCFGRFAKTPSAGSNAPIQATATASNAQSTADG